MPDLRFPFRRTGGLLFCLAALAAPMVGCKVSRSGLRAHRSLAMAQLPSATKTESIVVGSSDFGNNGTIPDRLSAAAHGGSPQQSWSPVVDGKSNAVIVEDPDAPSLKPHVHWLAWNIPADAAGLPPSQPNIAQAPSGMRQGKNGAGTMGWSWPASARRPRAPLPRPGLRARRPRAQRRAGRRSRYPGGRDERTRRR